MLDSPPRLFSLIKGGKRVHGHAYIHTSLLSKQPKKIVLLVDLARRQAGITADDFTVIRISEISHEIGLLNYPRFFEDPFPSLANAHVADVNTKRVRSSDYSTRENPPILHRKELLLPADHPGRERFEALTAALEKRGAFADSQ